MTKQEIKCAICGAEKVVQCKSLYKYKIDSVYYCSYKCFRVAERQTPKKKRRILGGLYRQRQTVGRDFTIASGRATG